MRFIVAVVVFVLFIDPAFSCLSSSQLSFLQVKSTRRLRALYHRNAKNEERKHEEQKEGYICHFFDITLCSYLLKTATMGQANYLR